MASSDPSSSSSCARAGENGHGRAGEKRAAARRSHGCDERNAKPLASLACESDSRRFLSERTWSFTAAVMAARRARATSGRSRCELLSWRCVERYARLYATRAAFECLEYERVGLRSSHLPAAQTGPAGHAMSSPMSRRAAWPGPRRFPPRGGAARGDVFACLTPAWASLGTVCKCGKNASVYAFIGAVFGRVRGLRRTSSLLPLRGSHGSAEVGRARGPGRRMRGSSRGRRFSYMHKTLSPSPRLGFRASVCAFTWIEWIEKAKGGGTNRGERGGWECGLGAAVRNGNPPVGPASGRRKKQHTQRRGTDAAETLLQSAVMESCVARGASVVGG